MKIPSLWNRSSSLSSSVIRRAATLSAVMLAASASTLLAEERYELAPGVTVGGSFRSRFEYKYDFKFDGTAPGNTDNFFLSQLRLNLKWQIAEPISFFVEGQDSAIQGDNAVDEDAVPNTFNDEFDLHQGYFDYVHKSEDMPVSLRLGRQKLKYGDERLVGPLEWVNTARVFDAAKVTIGNAAERSADVFASRAVGVDPHDFNDWSSTPNRYANSDFYGIYYSDHKLIESSVPDAYYLFRHEEDVQDEVHTIGARFAGKWTQWDLDGEAAYQTGDFGGLDHNAFAAHIGTGYLLCAESKMRVGAAYNYGSGDDDAADSDHGTFDNLFPTNHAFYGYMDFFSLQNMHNLEMTFNVSPVEDLDLRLAWQNFWLAEEDTDSWYNAGLGVVRSPNGADNDSYVGSEVDFTAAYPIWKKRLAFLVGYSHFFTGGYVEDTGSSKDADYVYFQGKLAF